MKKGRALKRLQKMGTLTGEEKDGKGCDKTDKSLEKTKGKELRCGGRKKKNWKSRTSIKHC